MTEASWRGEVPLTTSGARISEIQATELNRFFTPESKLQIVFARPTGIVAGTRGGDELNRVRNRALCGLGGRTEEMNRFLSRSQVVAEWINADPCVSTAS